MAQLPLVQALALGLVLALGHLSPQDLAPPLVLVLVRVWVLELAQESAEALAQALGSA